MKKITILLLTILSLPLQAQTILMKTITASRQYVTTRPLNSAVLEIKFADSNSTCYIQKPLIVVEDFDSGFLGKENPLGELDLNDFFREVKDHGGLSLNSQLNTYDIIYVNWMNASDYMQNNAYLVEDIIQWVNNEKQGSQPNVVLGQGMGGLIARYALRDMEIHNKDHHTSLYISHDAPHQGANVPLSVQYFVHHLANQVIKTNLGDFLVPPADTGFFGTDNNDLVSLFNKTGTLQLMREYVNSDFVVEKTEGEAWRKSLDSIGYPQNNIINIAISNGSHCANTQPFAPLDNLFSIQAHIKTEALTHIAQALLPILRLAANPISLLDIKDFFGSLKGISKFNADFTGKALPAPGSSGEIYHGSMSYVPTFLGFNGKTHDMITPRSFSAPSGTLPYDYYPGGQTERFADPISKSLSNDLGSLFVDADFTVDAKGSYDYIPTPSALDVGGPTATLNNNDYLAKYNKVTPPQTSGVPQFDNYTTSYNTLGTNENHISFNTKNGNWLADELANSPKDFDCTFMCSAKISGNKTMCSSGTYSFVPGMKYYNWSVNGTNVVTWSGNHTDTITLTQVGTNSGYVTISLDFDSDYCGNIPLTKTIWVGKPVLPLIYLPPLSTVPALEKTGSMFGGWNGVTNSSNYNYCKFTIPQSIIADQGITAIAWTKNATNSNCDYNNSGILKTWDTPNTLTTSAYASQDSAHPWGISINISLTNGCLVPTNTTAYYCFDGLDTTGLDPDYGPIPDSNMGKKVNTPTEPTELTDTIPVYPNPSNGIFNIDLTSVKGEYETVKVYNMLGALVYEGDLKAKSPNLINLTSMSTGCYIAKISGSNENSSFQLIKQ